MPIANAVGARANQPTGAWHFPKFRRSLCVDAWPISLRSATLYVMLDWDDLRSFLAIAREGTLSGAARVLKVQQSTMGRRLDALETSAGARLFQKTPAGFVLTAAGEAVLARVERMEAEALAVERAITGRDIRLEGTIRLTTVESLAVEVLTPILASFRTTYPGICLEVATDTRSLSLTKREADVALRLARLTQNDLAVRKVGDLSWGVYASPSYLDRHGEPDWQEGAPDHATVLTDADLMALPEMAWFRRLTAKARPVLRSNSRYAHRAAAATGIGLACLARYLGDDCPGLIRLAVPPDPPVRELWLAVHNDTRHTPRIRALTECITVGLKQRAAMLHPPP